MKILLISNLYPKTNRLESDKNTKAIHNIIKKWDEDVRVIAPVFMPSELNGDSYQLGNQLLSGITVKVTPVWKIPKTNLYFYNKLIRQYQKDEWRADIVITHRLHCAILGNKLKKKFKIPHVIGLHQTDINILKSENVYKEYFSILDEADLIACRSEQIKKQFINIKPELESKCFVAYSGIEKEEIINIKETLIKHAEWKHHKRPIRFVTAAVLKTQKNIAQNLKVLSMMGKNVKWEYKIIGEGNELANLKKLVKDLKLEEKVSFLGKIPRKEVMEHLNMSDVYIMVSSPETLGLAYLEAMAKGCIVIGAKNNGIDGIVNNKINGYLVDVNDVNDYYNVINELLYLDNERFQNLIMESFHTINNYTEEMASNNYLEEVYKVFKGR